MMLTMVMMIDEEGHEYDHDEIVDDHEDHDGHDRNDDDEHDNRHHSQVAMHS